MPQPIPAETNPEFQALMSKLFTSEPAPRLMVDDIRTLLSQLHAAEANIERDFHDFCERHFDGRRPTLLVVPPTLDCPKSTELCGVRVFVSEYVDGIYALFCGEVTG